MTALRALPAIVVLALAALGSPGCDSAPCEAAADKIEACLSRLDCRDADPTQISKCNAAQSRGQDALNQLRSLPCTGTVSDTADLIDRCPIDQMPYCNCFN